LFKSPEGNTILIPGVKMKVKHVKLLGTNSALKYSMEKTGVRISTEGIPVDDIDTVIVVEFN
jgi:alpha-L-fucosidase